MRAYRREHANDFSLECECEFGMYGDVHCVLLAARVARVARARTAHHAFIA